MNEFVRAKVVYLSEEGEMFDTEREAFDRSMQEKVENILSRAHERYFEYEERSVAEQILKTAKELRNFLDVYLTEVQKYQSQPQQPESKFVTVCKHCGDELYDNATCSCSM